MSLTARSASFVVTMIILHGKDSPAEQDAMIADAITAARGRAAATAHASSIKLGHV